METPTLSPPVPQVRSCHCVPRAGIEERIQHSFLFYLFASLSPFSCSPTCDSQRSSHLGVKGSRKPRHKNKNQLAQSNASSGSWSSDHIELQTIHMQKRLQNPSFRWLCFINGMSSHNYQAVVSNNELRNTGNGHNILIYWVGSLKCHLWGSLFSRQLKKSVLKFLGEKNKSHTRKIELFLYWHEWQIHIQKNSASGLFLCFLNSIRLNKVNRNKVSQEIIC